MRRSFGFGFRFILFFSVQLAVLYSVTFFLNLILSLQ